MTTLDDLKRAIEAVKPEEFWDDAKLSNYHAAMSHAWRAAFEWLQAHHGPNGEDDYSEGMALIREKLS